MEIDDTNTLITMSLDDRPHYTTKITIFGKVLNLQCSYNTRSKKRWIIITDNNNLPLLSQTFIKHKKQCEFNFLANLYNLNFYVTLKKKRVTDIIPDDYDYLNWSKDFDMYFVGSTQDLQDRLTVNGRSAYVGS